jgi:hypothetical protein
MIEAALEASASSGKDLFITILCDVKFNNLLEPLFKFAGYLNNHRLFLDLRTGLFNPSTRTPKTKLYLGQGLAISADNWNSVARKITCYLESNPDAHHSDNTHLELQKLLTLGSLHTASFLSSTYPEIFDKILSEALYATRISRPSNLSAASQVKPRFSLISSLYKAKNYLPRLLENYEAIASLGPCELVIVDVNSDSSDRDIFESFAHSSDYAHTIQYIKLTEDPGIYGCWQKGIDSANSPYVSNFNADDRRSAIHPHLLANYLESHPDVDVCFTALKPTNDPNISWYEHYGEETWFNWFKQDCRFTLDDFVTIRDGIYCSQNIAHCMPMWRKRLHEALGPFREDKFGTSADWAFWLECMNSGKVLAMASSAPYGLYLISPSSHNRINDIDGAKENLILSTYYGIIQTSFMQQ